ncbi:MAG TPA: ABC transporter permease [Dongiaceae bacterium]|nr:ABC transporter permease [Dongiaceae bacterium]
MTRRIFRLLPPGSARIGLLLLALVLAITIFGPAFAPLSPLDFIGTPFQAPNAQAWLGTDVLGRDVLSRLLLGGYRILGLSALATVLGVLAGALLGMAAGYAKGAADEIIMRLLDVVLAFPQIILALLFVSIIGPELWLIVLIVAGFHAPQVARVARAATLRVVEEDYVRFAETIGMSRLRILTQEIFPNILTPLIVEAGLRLTYSIALIAGLNFLGLGTQPPTPDWGLMINENRIGMATNPWPVLLPVLLIALLTIGTNLLADALGRAAFGRDGARTDGAGPAAADGNAAAALADGAGIAEMRA